MKSILTILLLSISIIIEIKSQTKKSDPIKYLFVGTYTAKVSEGIYVYKFNTQTGDFESVSHTKGIKNPSFLSISPNGKNVYSVNENGDLGGVTAFSFDKNTGQLALLNSSIANGDHTCHLEMNADGKHLAVGNYTGGNLCLFKINAGGSLMQNPQIINHKGTGPNKDRQEKAHVHSVNWAPNQKDLFVPDLGMDKIMHYTLSNGKLQAGIPAFTEVQAGSGPRHFTFHPNGKFAYVIQELGNLVTAFNYKNGQLSKIDSYTTLPANYNEKSYTADIHISPDGKFLYGSNRGHNSLAIYAINQKTGTLKLIDIESVKGNWPRNFMIDPTGNFILVANEKSDNVTIFKRNKLTGMLTATGKEMKISMPVCLKML
jgi:6-phosphogluconolactonase